MNDEDFEIDLPDESTIIITSQSKSRDIVDKALSSYSGEYKIYSKYLTSDSYMNTTLTEDKLNKLAYRAQENISQIQEINSYIDFYLNKDDIIGKTYEIIEANTNSKYELIYPKVEGRNKSVALDKVKKVVENFNTQINIKSLIVDTIPYVYSNGNRIMYLRRSKDNKYLVDKYPLGVVEVSPFKINDDNIIVFNISELIGRLGDTSATSYATQLVFKEEFGEQLRLNYPEEVYNAYKEGKTAVKLEINNCGVIRTNNRGKLYGLSPIFKALNPALKLEVQEKSDGINSKARGKKIVFQKISDKLLGADGTTIDLAPTFHAHKELLEAWKNDVVLITGAPWVDSITYVEPKIDNTQTDNLSYYRSKTLSALGISFLNGDSKTGLASMQINLNELMYVIDKISKQLEEVVNKWYKVLMVNEGLPLEYAPTIRILDSELMENDTKMKLAEFMFSKANVSYQSTLNLLGLDYETEKERRMNENTDGVEEIFYPRASAYTMSGEDDKVDNKEKSLQPQTIKDKAKKEGE